MPAPVTPLTPQDVADCVNALGVDKATFATFLQGAALLAERNKITAQIAQAQAAAAAAQQSSVNAVQQLNSQLAAVDGKYNAAFGAGA